MAVFIEVDGGLLQQSLLMAAKSNGGRLCQSEEEKGKTLHVQNSLCYDHFDFNAFLDRSQGSQSSTIWYTKLSTTSKFDGEKNI